MPDGLLLVVVRADVQDSEDCKAIFEAGSSVESLFLKQEGD